ncbi:MAG TPA: hypothetical protein DCR93_27695, partial [Cytophagales bacterium]|nr:hypothetical protein [Cytophagales bacterium]
MNKLKIFPICLGISLYVLVITCIVSCQPHPVPEGITVTQLEHPSLQAHLISKLGNQIRPWVVLVSGSSGGYFPDHHVYGLVEQGYDILSLACFGVEGTPDKLVEIPLEYVQSAIDYARSELGGDSRGVVLMGPSRGGELALLYASHFHDVDGVIAYSPGTLVIPETIHVWDAADLRSSWSLGGDPVPFAPMPLMPEEPGWVDFHGMYSSLWADSAVVAQARIPVEQITCPVLLLAGESDGVWPAAAM